MLERSSRRTVDFVVIGAGVVGCALARELAAKGRSVVILEREEAEGRGVSSRNSGVVHSGIFGTPGTRKLRSCVEGRELLYAFASEHGVPHRRTGKLVLVADESQRSQASARVKTAKAAGIEVKRLTRKQAIARESALQSASFISALYLPQAGIVDAHALCSALLNDARERGAFFAPNAPVSPIEIHPDKAIVRSERGPIDTHHVINAAGLYADAVAKMVGLDRTVFPCRGDYFYLDCEAEYAHLIYPLSKASDSGLGVHLTLGLDGRMRLGPDAQWVVDKDDFSAAPHKKAAFIEAAKALLGVEFEPQRLSYDTCGIRPKRYRHGEDPVDFEILATPRCIHLLGIESPGLTSAMSLAREVAAHLARRS